MSANPLIDLLDQKVSDLGRVLTLDEFKAFLKSVDKDISNFENFASITGAVNTQFCLAVTGIVVGGAREWGAHRASVVLIA